jgi:glycosyltransferase involved in cell wall biosynthesis
MYHCLSPKLAGLKLVTLRTCEDCYCRDHAAGAATAFLPGSPDRARVVDDPGRIRHLLYHVYPHAQGGSVWRWNVEQLRRRLSLFNGRRVIGVATGPETEPAAAVRAALVGCGCEFIEVANDPALREVTTFEPLFSAVSGFTGPEHATFYGHAKGITSEGWAPGVRRWTEAMLSTCLDHWPAVRALLSTHPLVGSFKRLGWCFAEEPVSDWHYSGSWRWHRNADLFGRDWRKITPAWIGIEAHPSLHFGPDEAGCLVHEFQDAGLALYTHEYWQQRAGPELARWHVEHFTDRWVPLLLSCVLVSHRQPRWVHDAVRSVLAQTSPDWQLVIIDTGELADELRQYETDPRVRVHVDPWARSYGAHLNTAHRSGRLVGDLVCYLPEGDVYNSGAFAAWLDAARCRPWQEAWYGSVDRVEVRVDSEVKVGEVRADVAGGLGGVSLDCRAGAMQLCHRARWLERVEWPEDRRTAWHADGVFLDRLGQLTTVHPLPVKIGRHRHPTASMLPRTGNTGAASATPPLLSIIVPTIGRPSLADALASIAAQSLGSDGEVICVADGIYPQLARLWGEAGLRGRYLETPGRSGDFGGTPRNLAMPLAQGDWLLFLDDDDIYLPGALEVIRSVLAAGPRRPHLFRMRHYPSDGGILWRKRTVEFGNVSTQMIAVPNDPGRLGSWGDKKGSDFAFITSTLAHYAEGPVWRDEVIAEWNHKHAARLRDLASQQRSG